jgi:hypothetical protein
MVNQMTRTADYTIQGFLYQFNKTIMEILRASDDAQITVEGIIEDIDIEDISGIKATQCKYHEGQQNFSLSSVYKSILQMMKHFCDNNHLDIRYILYAYFPNETYLGLPHPINRDQMSAVLQTQNKDLKQYTEVLKEHIDIDEFLKHFTLMFGKSLSSLVNDVCIGLRDNGIPEDDIQTLAYPNAIQAIFNLSIRHDEESRKITKSLFLYNLNQIRKTAISRWTLSLKSYKMIIRARKKQLKPNLDKNARLRYFIINQSSIEDFLSGTILFINDYLDKYHFKTAHIKTPLFCLDCSQDDFKNIRLRLHQSGVIAVDGFVGDYFDKVWFFREPISTRISRTEVKREFRIRLLRFDTNVFSFFEENKCDDLFIIGNGKYDELDIQDVNAERLAVRNLNEIKYLLGVSNVYE